MIVHEGFRGSFVIGLGFVLGLVREREPVLARPLLHEQPSDRILLVLFVVHLPCLQKALTKQCQRLWIIVSSFDLPFHPLYMPLSGFFARRDSFGFRLDLRYYTVMETLINRVILGDCLEVMPQIDSDSIDLILCDLPYGVTARNKWDQVIPFDKLWEEYTRIAKDNAAIVLTATQPFASQLIMSNPALFRYDLIWTKNKKTGFLNAKKMPLRAHECILVFYKKLPTYNPQKTTGHKPVNSYTKHTSDGTNYGETQKGIKGGGQTDRYPTSVLYFPVVNNDSKEKLHPTQKPVELFEWLIRTYSNENMLVLDNCIGSGTTGIAAVRTNRRFIGIENDEVYYRTACKRVYRQLAIRS